MPLSIEHVCAIEGFLAEESDHRTGSRPGAGPSLLEIRVRGQDLLVEPVIDGDVTAWIGAPLDAACEAVGLCVPVASDLSMGAVVDRSGNADTFAVDRGCFVFDDLRSTRSVEDICRRRLGLATDPPTIGTDWYWMIRWLVEVAAGCPPSIDPSGPPLDVVTVAGLHPAVEREELIGLDRAGISRFVVERHRDHAAAADWECVRLDALIDDRHPAHGWARHLDEGAFSRWMSTQGVALSALAEELIAGCSPFALDLIASVVSDVVVRHECR